MLTYMYNKKTFYMQYALFNYKGNENFPVI